MTPMPSRRPAQATQDDSSAFASFVAAASRQAARSHPGIELLAGLSAGTAPSAPSADTMFDAFLGTRLTVAGYGVSGSAPAATAAGVAFLRRLERLDCAGRRGRRGSTQASSTKRVVTVRVSPAASRSTQVATYGPGASAGTFTPRAVSTLAAWNTRCLDPAGRMVRVTGTPAAEIAPCGPGSPDCAEATKDPYRVSSWIGAVDSISGTWVTVCPPEKSSVWAMSAADSPLAWPLSGTDGPGAADAGADRRR